MLFYTVVKTVGMSLRIGLPTNVGVALASWSSSICNLASSSIKWG